MTTSRPQAPTDGPLIGAHMSIAGGVENAPLRGLALTCRCIQIFTCNARRWTAAPLKPDAAARFKAHCRKTGVGPALAHNSYLINLATQDEALFDKSFVAFLGELQRCEALGLPGVVAHPGAHGGAGVEAGIQRIADALNALIAQTPKARVKALLETTSGQGSCIGGRFEHLAEIIRRVRRKSRVAVCFDTCHAFAAGYDLRTPAACRETFAEFDRVIGLNRLAAFHFNDSKGGLGSGLDRHEHLGRGKLGREAFRFILRDPRFADVPKILENAQGPARQYGVGPDQPEAATQMGDGVRRENGEGPISNAQRSRIKWAIMAL